MTSTPERDRWLERLCKVTLQSPLIDSRATLPALESARRASAPRAVFVGLGLCTDYKVSPCMPLDVLGILLPAEQIRRAIGASRLVTLVADQHALRNDFSELLVEKRARQTVRLLGLLRRQFGLDSLEVLRASSLHGTADYQAVRETVGLRASDEDHSYFKDEVADVAYLNRTLGGIVKVGWTVGALPDGDRRQDEVAFDERFNEWVGAPVPFVYCKAGRTLNDERPKAAPYVTVNRRTRICLSPDEVVASKLDEARRFADPATIRGVRKHLNGVCRSFCQLVAPLRGPLEQRVQQIISIAFAGEDAALAQQVS